jgi:hypothetical protein
MNGELLHDTVDRRGQSLELGSLLRLDHVLRKAGGLLLCFGQRVIDGASIFLSRVPFSMAMAASDAEPALLHDDILLEADQIRHSVK